MEEKDKESGERVEFFQERKIKKIVSYILIFLNIFLLTMFILQFKKIIIENASTGNIAIAINRIYSVDERKKAILLLAISVIVYIINMFYFHQINKNSKKGINKNWLPIQVLIGIIILISSIIFFEAYTNTLKREKEILNYDNGEVQGSDKPIIYLYPEEETEVSVVAKYPEKFTHTYPKYESSWEVIAQPDGTLYDTKTERELYALYWEGKSEINSNIEEGFCVKGEDTISFLEEKLAILGLNEREAEEFIIYWLPVLEENKYNYIYFMTTEEVEEIMPLEITPKPDTRIRILMRYKAIDEAIEVKKQEIVTPEREGFVMVEWGGSEIK